MDLHNWIMEIHNYGILSPLALHSYMQLQISIMEIQKSIRAYTSTSKLIRDGPWPTDLYSILGEVHMP